jgi:hypothetical protein
MTEGAPAPTVAPKKKPPDHLGDDRLARRPKVSGPGGPLRPCAGGLAAERPEVVGLTADLAKYTDLHVFAQAYPERFYQMGMAEQLLMAAAAGMARKGALPFATTYAVFAARRAYDFICQAIAEENLNVKIAARCPGSPPATGRAIRRPRISRSSAACRT